jgi:hypothetical protein
MAALSLVLVASGCSGDSKKTDVDSDVLDQTSGVDVILDVDRELTPDLVADTVPDSLVDVVDAEDVQDREMDTPDISPYLLPELTSPVPFRFGAAGRLLPAPIGAPTCGFMPGPGIYTPYSENFAGSQGAYQHPTMRVFVLEGGTSRLLLIRLDMIATNTLFVERVAHDLTQITGYDWTGKVIIGASHTHSSTGRVAPGPIWEIMADTFFPQLFDQILNGLVETALEAIVDMEPARMGYTTIDTDRLHNDRRCENPPVQDDRLHLFRFENLEGKIKGLFLVHSLHGTLFDPKERFLSRDSFGGIEEKIKERFDYPFEVMMFQAGAGDMSPGDPKVELPGLLPEIPPKMTRIEALGQVAADLIEAALPDIQTSTDVPLQSRWHYVDTSYDVYGYAEGEFPYFAGGAYCGSNIDAQCWTGEPTPIPDLDKTCLDIAFMAVGAGFPGETAPDRTLVVAATIGEILMVTFPGEPVTQVLLNVEEGIREKFPSQEKIVVVGYAMDYNGYSTPEWDWYQGAYEASGAMWGPKQGDYLTDRAIEIGVSLLDPGQPVPFVDPGPYPLLVNDVPPWKTASSVGGAYVVTQPEAAVATGETVVFEFAGGDPWFLLPNVVLEKMDGEGDFRPVTRPNGSLVDSAGYEYVIKLIPQPNYDTDPGIKPRVFVWRFTFATDRVVPAAIFPLQGTYRFHVTGRMRVDPSPESEEYTLVSEPFVVGE